MGRTIPDSGTLDVRLSEWMDALADCRTRQSDDGFTSAELADAWGVCLKTAGDRIRALARRGLVKAGQREGVSLIGRRIVSPVYRIARAKP